MRYQDRPRLFGKCFCCAFGTVVDFCSSCANALPGSLERLNTTFSVQLAFWHCSLQPYPQIQPFPTIMKIPVFLFGFPRSETSNKGAYCSSHRHVQHGYFCFLAHMSWSSFVEIKQMSFTNLRSQGSTGRSYWNPGGGCSKAVTLANILVMRILYLFLDANN